MPRTKTDLFNRIIANLGQIKATQIEIWSEATSDARTVRRFYEDNIEAFLEESWWSFATGYADLSLDSSTAPEAWAYAYKAPADMVAPRRIVGVIPEELPPFEEGISASGIKVIWSDQQEAELEYTKFTEDFNVWSPTAYRALSLFVSIDVAPAYTGGNKVNEIMALYADALERAQAASANRQERRPDTGDEITNFRHGLVQTSRAVRGAATYKP